MGAARNRLVLLDATCAEPGLTNNFAPDSVPFVPFRCGRSQESANLRPAERPSSPLVPLAGKSRYGSSSPASTEARRAMAVSIPDSNAASRLPSPNRSLRTYVVNSFPRSSAVADATASG
jgi:hypothetical protein